MIICIVLLIIYFVKKKKCFFDALCYGIVLTIGFLFLQTELLSLVKQISFKGYIISWIIIDISLGLFLIKTLKVETNQKERVYLNKMDFLFLVHVILALISIIFAIISTPYNYDSMTYHLARIAHWTNNQSVSYYATHTLRQLTSPILSEYVMLYTYNLLDKKDYLVNLVQAISYVLNAIILFKICKKLVTSKMICVFASIIFMSIPIVVAESVTTQNDVFATTWMLIFVYFILDFINSKNKLKLDENSVEKIFILGLCMAFGYLSKPSVCIAMPFFLAWLLIVCIHRRDSWFVFFQCLIIGGCTCIVPIIPTLYRNYMMMGTFSAHITGARQLVGTVDPKYVFVNFVKNITYNLPNVYIKDSSEYIYSFVTKFAKVLKVNIDDASISEDGVEFAVRSAIDKGMDSAVNPLPTFIFLVLGIFILYILICNKKGLRKNIGYQFVLVSVISFCAFLAVLRWEMFISRYMISYYGLVAISFAVFLEYISKRLNKAILFAICLFTLAFSIEEYCMTLIQIIQKTNIYATREENYFINNHDYYELYKVVAQLVEKNNYKSIGFLSNENYYDYPLIKMVENKVDRYEHVVLKKENYIYNYSYIYEDYNFEPDCIFVIATYIDSNSVFLYNGAKYENVFSQDEGWISFWQKIK